MDYVSRSILRKVYKKRGDWVHKGQFGKLVVIGGSERHTGSPCFVGMAAYRAGCDLVYIVAPQRAADVAANFSPCLITEPLEGGKLVKEYVERILSLIEETRSNAVAIGPGLWRDKETLESIIELIERINLPMVIDADAIRAISAKREALRENCVLTPHADEFRELTGIKVSTDISDRIKAVREQAKRLHAIILLKGHIDVISDGRKTVLNRTGSTKMTVGGMGDTLTGILGGLMTRGCDAFDSACAATYINGRAGELAVKRFGESAITTDLIEELHNAIKF